LAEPAAFHVEAFEHRRVEQLARPVAAFSVRLATAGRECRGGFKNLLPLGEVRVEASETVVRRGEVRTDARLFDPERRDVDRARVVRVEELAPLGLGARAGA